MKVDDAGRLVKVYPEDLDAEGRFFCDEKISSIGMNAFYDVRFYLTYLSMTNVKRIET